MSFSCRDCDRYFKSSQGLESHCDAKDHDGLWECCSKEFYSWDAWDQHTTYAAAHMRSDCCGRTFRSKDALEQHMATATTHRTCDRCTITFDSIEEYEEHRCNKYIYKQPKPSNLKFFDELFKSPQPHANEQPKLSNLNSFEATFMSSQPHTYKQPKLSDLNPFDELFKPKFLQPYTQHIASGSSVHRATMPRFTPQVIPRTTAVTPALRYNPTLPIGASVNDGVGLADRTVVNQVTNIPAIQVDAPKAPVERGRRLNASGGATA